MKNVCGRARKRIKHVARNRIKNVKSKYSYLEHIDGFSTIAVNMDGSIVHFTKSLNFQMITMYTKVTFAGYREKKK